MKLDVLNRTDCLMVKDWRNKEPQFLRTPFMLTKEMQEDFYENVICNRNSPHRYFAIREGFKLIGMGGLTNIEWENGCCEISLIMDPEERGKGYGKQSVLMLMDHAFDSLRMETVYGEVYECGNYEFWKSIIEDMNGYSTRLKGKKFWSGVHWDSIWFSIRREK